MKPERDMAVEILAAETYGHFASVVHFIGPVDGGIVQIVRHGILHLRHPGAMSSIQLPAHASCLTQKVMAQGEHKQQAVARGTGCYGSPARCLLQMGCSLTRPKPAGP